MSSPSKVSIKPITNHSDVKLEFGENKKYSAVGNKYNGFNINPEPFIVKLSKCKVIGVYQSRPNGSEEEKKRARIYVSLSDPETIKIMKEIGKQVVSEAIKHKVRLFSEYDDEKLIEENYKSVLRYNDKYDSYSAYIDVSFKEWKYKPATMEDYTDNRKVYEAVSYQTLSEVLKKNSVLDLAVSIRKGNVDLSTDEYNVKFFADKINLIGYSESVDGSGMLGIKPTEFDKSKVTFTPVEKNKVSATKFIRINYDSKRFRMTLTDISARVIKMVTESGDTTYALALNPDENVTKVFDELNDVLYSNIVQNSADYFDKKRSETKIKSTYSPICNYGKTDLELIKKGEEPKYGRSVLLKIYYTPEHGIGAKIVNTTTNEKVKNPEDLLGDNLTISSLTFYNKHVWFGKKTSTSFLIDTINYDGGVSQDVDMDSVAMPSEDDDTSSQKEKGTSSNENEKEKEDDEASDTDEDSDDDEDDDDEDED